MADKKISQLTNLTGANLADNDEFVLVDTSADETKAITWSELKEGLDTGTGFVRITGDTMTGDLSFGDNDKAIFGAGSDLQIYHDNASNHSIIAESGAGSLLIRGQGVTLQNADGSKAYFGGSGDVATAYYGTSAKLATTATGIDVTGTVIADSANITGTVTADGLTVDGSGTAQITSTSGTTLELIRSGSAGQISSLIMKDGGNAQNRINSSDGSLEFEYGASNFNALKISNNGDISFYEDTGTTPKFFWDASAESLGIGTSSPASYGDLTLYKSGANDTKLALANNGNGGGTVAWTLKNDTAWDLTLSHNAGVGGQNLIFGTKTSGGESMRIDSSGNVGVGVTSPAARLDVNRIHNTSGLAGVIANPQLAITNNTNWGYPAGIVFRSPLTSGGAVTNSGAVWSEWMATPANSAYLAFATTNSGTLTERMRIDSSGNVGIGTSSPSSLYSGANNLVVGSGSGANGMSIFSGTTDAGRIYFADGTSGAGTYAGYVEYNHNTNTMQLGTNGSTKAVIDSSGHLLVGTTDTGIYDDATDEAGHNLLANGQYYNSAVSEINMILNKQNSDGDIVQFRKDGTTVGGIGTDGTHTYIVGNDTSAGNGSGLLFGINTATPVNRLGAPYDGLMNLGAASDRFKDLYLSGGVYLGGTGAANKLDDYEEGAWTPTVKGETTAGTATYLGRWGNYTKIGNLVTVRFYLNVNSFNGTGVMRISGLPFTSGADNGIAAGGINPVRVNGTISLTTDGVISLAIVEGSTEAIFFSTSVTTNANSSAVDCDAAWAGQFEGSYFV